MIFTTEHLLRAKDYNFDKPRPIRWIQRKEDGFRVFVRRQVDGRFTCLTRNGKTDFYPELVSKMYGDVFADTVPYDSVIDCELCALDASRQSTDLPTLLKERRFASLKLTAFAVPIWDGKRIDDMGDAMRFAGSVGVDFVWTMMVAANPAIPSMIDRHSAEQLLRSYADPHGAEGLMLKEGHYDGWWKLKRKRRLDVYVTDTLESDSDTWSGGLKSICIAVRDGDKDIDLGQVGSGFEGEFRMQVDRHTLPGKVAEIECDGMAGAGKLRFPRFIRWRDDKSPLECTVEQLEALRRKAGDD